MRNEIFKYFENSKDMTLWVDKFWEYVWKESLEVHCHRIGYGPRQTFLEYSEDIFLVLCNSSTVIVRATSGTRLRWCGVLTIYQRIGEGFGDGACFFGFWRQKAISLFYCTNWNETVRASYEYERLFGEAEKPGIYPLFLFYFVSKEGKITKKRSWNLFISSSSFNSRDEWTRTIDILLPKQTP